MNTVMAQRQQLALAPIQMQSLAILKMDPCELSDMIKKELQENPILEVRGDWDPIKICKSSSGINEEICQGPDQNLYDELLMQMTFYVNSPTVRRIGEYIIYCIDKDGYLTETIRDISKALKIDLKLTKKLIRLIQTFEPAGVGARSLKECLLIQLKHKHIKDELTEKIIKNHLQDLAKNNLANIFKAENCLPEQLTRAVEIIKSLNPRPGAVYKSDDDIFIIPEVIILAEDNNLRVELINEPPKLFVSELFKTYIKDEDTVTRQYAKCECKRARYFIHCVEQRQNTLLKTTQCIIKYQYAFFLHDEPPVPLTLETVAEELNMNVSTISRAISGKYFQFGEKIYSFHDFFPSRLKSGNSSDGVKLLIKKIIESEDKSKPLSDQKIAGLLKREGIQIALRTVTKYRMSLRLPSSSKRKLKTSI